MGSDWTELHPAREEFKKRVERGREDEREEGGRTSAKEVEDHFEYIETKPSSNRTARGHAAAEMLFAAAGIKNVNAIGRIRGEPAPLDSSLLLCLPFEPLASCLNFFLESGLIGETGRLPLLTRVLVHDNLIEGVMCNIYSPIISGPFDISISFRQSIVDNVEKNIMEIRYIYFLCV